MPRLAFVMVLLAVVASCSERNPDFCPNGATPNGAACIDAPPGTGDHCTATSGCTGLFPLCELAKNGGTCVQCTADDLHLCSGATPLCVNNACTGCMNHSDCKDSNVCMPDGSCALASDVAYVDGTTGMDGMPCTRAMPCAKIEDGVAKKSIVKVSGTVMHRCSLNNVSTKTQILADPGAKLEPTENGPALEVKGNSNIEVYDLQIDKAQGSADSGVALTDMASLILTRVTVRDNPGNGISVTGGVQLSCTRCLLAKNGGHGIDVSLAPTPTPQNPITQKTTIIQSTISDNMGGGVRVNGAGAFHIVSNFVFGNGQSSKTGAAGIVIQVDTQPADAPANELNFNSINHNVSLDPEQGILCSSGTPFVANSNIVWNNGILGKLLQVSSASGCSYQFSDIGPTPETQNMNIDPAFLGEASGDLHLMKDSMMRGKADPGLVPSGLAAKDIDGDARPTAARADIGADQFVMP